MKKSFDLEKRTFLFARNIYIFSLSIPKNFGSYEYCKQLIRSSASIGANYIEANESLGPKDFFLHIKICRKEAKESRYWLSLLTDYSVSREQEYQKLFLEPEALMKIFGSIAIQQDSKKV